MSHLTQMAGLTVQNFVSAAVGICRRGRARSAGSLAGGATTIGNFWVDLVADDDARPAAALHRRRARCSRARASCRTCAARPRRPRSRAPRSRSTAARSRARRRSRSSARTAAARQRELGAPVREPDRVHEPRSRCGAAADPVRAHVRVRPAGRRTGDRAGRSSRRCSCSGSARRRSRRTSRSTATRDVDAGGRRQHGGQGGALRRRRVGASSRRSTTGTSTGAVDRRPRQLHAARRRGPARQHDARRGLAGRRRRRALRDARLRPARGVHRRADGRADAGVPRQEDPGGGDEARRRSTCSSSRCSILAFAAVSVVLDDGEGVDPQPRRRTGCPRSSTPSPRRRTTTARPSAASPGTPTGTTRRSGWRCSAAASC